MIVLCSNRHIAINPSYGLQNAYATMCICMYVCQSIAYDLIIAMILLDQLHTILLIQRYL